MAEVRTRAENAPSVIPDVSLDTPEAAMFLPASVAEQGLPIDALNAAVTRAQGVLDCAYCLLESEEASKSAMRALWAVMGLLDQTKNLLDFAYQVERKRISGASTEGGNHA